MDSASSPVPKMNSTMSFQPGLREYLAATFFILMTFVTMAFNSFSLVVLHRWRHEFEDLSRIILRSLAVVNMASGVSIGIFEGFVYYLSRGRNAEMFCRFTPALGIYLMFSSIYHVALMNLQRYLAICYPFRYNRIATVKRLNVLFTVMDFTFIGISCAFLPFPNFPFNEFVRSLCLYRSVVFSKFDSSLLRDTKLFYAIFGILYITPFVLLTYINIRLLIIARRASRQRHMVSVHKDKESGNAYPRTTGLKGLRTVLIITGLFYISVTPFAVIMCGFVLPTTILDQESYDALFFLSNAVLICSCWWNVPVYMSTSTKVRQRALHLWQNLKCLERTR